MRYQSTQSTCGAAAVANALASRGHMVTEEGALLASGLRDPTQGLAPRHIRRALETLGWEPGELWEARPAHAWLMLLASLDDGRPVILSVDQGAHWVAATSSLGRGSARLVHLADSAHSELIIPMPREALLARWEGTTGRRPYFGIICCPTGGR